MAQGKLGDDKPRTLLPLGHIDAVENKERREGEPLRWARVRLKDENGEKLTFLFSYDELKTALLRAEEQKEDLPPTGWLQKIHDKLL